MKVTPIARGLDGVGFCECDIMWVIDRARRCLYDEVVDYLFVCVWRGFTTVCL